MNPRYPVYIPSKGRWATCHTAKALDRMGVPFRVVVEAPEFDQYAAAVGEDRLLVIPTVDKGLVVVRNWIWDHARDSGTPRFWTMDDNILGLFRFNRNLKVPVSSGTVMRVAEEFVERYENVPIAGFNYFMFVRRKEGGIPPFYLNTRVYSNMLIETDVRDTNGEPFRNEGFYNDDTDLCIRVLQAGYCTVLFNAFLIDKCTTMTVRGGMTPHYQATSERKEDDGRWRMAEELRAKHPDVTTVVRRWGRWQHHVDYRGFRANRLKRSSSTPVDAGVNNFGMVLERRVGDEWRRCEGAS